ncbi:hypothetical protein DD237_005718 [Peronospora effusa]|uniref:Uncharacterized protein n=1 Tax=Peronospora effusa TaxID=542832 RepID=A0A3R7YU01_9STRA|nr:hypothetical protein DD237_005718 [Peronospora effusa]
MYKGNGRTLAGQPRNFFGPATYIKFAVVPLHVKLSWCTSVLFNIVFLPVQAPALIFWLDYTVFLGLSRYSLLGQLLLPSISAHFMTGFLMLLRSKNSVYLEYGPFLSSVLTQCCHCRAWVWMKDLRHLCGIATSKWGSIYFQYMKTCYTGFSIMFSSWDIGCNISLVHLLYVIMDVELWRRRLTSFETKFQPLFTSPLGWNSVLLFIIEPTLDAKTLYGYRLFVVFHIVRAVIFRCL